MGFNVSGLIGAGAQEGLAELLQRQMVEQQLAERTRQFDEEQRRRQAEDAQQAQYQNAALESLKQDREERQTLAANAQTDRRNAAAAQAQSEQAVKDVRTNMGGVMNMPGMTDEQRLSELDQAELRSGVEVPAAIRTRLTPKQIKRREVTELRPGGVRVNRMAGEDEEVIEPGPAPAAPRQPSFVTMPDGTVKDIMGVAPEGSQPFQRPVRQALTPAETATHSRMLRSQFMREVATTREVQRQSSMMDSGLAAAQKGDLAAGSQAVLVTFQKILDPTSVVRESEYARSASGQALMARMEGAMERLARGGAGIPLPELQKFADLARTFVANAAEREEGIREHYTLMAEELGLNPTLVVGKSVSQPGGGGGAAPAGGGAATHRWNPQTKKLEPVQ
jgi:hypothetical protein